MRFQKLRSMMPKAPGPGVASPMGAPMPKVPAMPQAMPQAAPVAPPMTRATLPSIQATENSAMPLELGDPKRLSKIGTILRMGRK